MLDPATGEIIARCGQADREQADGAVAAALQAFECWSRMPAARQQALRDCADVLDATGESIATLLTSEQGKRLAKAREEVELAATWY